MYGETVAEFEEAIAKIRTTFGETQNPILQYLDNTYLLYAKQWARCYIKYYRNFGIRTGSPTESVHHHLKSYLKNSRSTMDVVYDAVERMVDERFDDYKKTKAGWQGIHDREMMDRDWLGNLRTSIVFPALKKIVQQYKLYQKHEPSRKNPTPPPPQPCTKSVMQQFALPCSHRIKELLVEQGGHLSKENVHPRWWLQLPLDNSDPFLRINDPVIKNNPLIDVANKKDESLRRLASKRKRKQPGQTQVVMAPQQIPYPSTPSQLEPHPSSQMNFAMSSSQPIVPLSSVQMGSTMPMSQPAGSFQQPLLPLGCTNPLSQPAGSFQQSLPPPIAPTASRPLPLPITTNIPSSLTTANTLPPPVISSQRIGTSVSPSFKVSQAKGSSRPIAPSSRRRISHDEIDIHHPFDTPSGRQSKRYRMT